MCSSLQLTFSFCSGELERGWSVYLRLLGKVCLDTDSTGGRRVTSPAPGWLGGPSDPGG